MRSVAVGAALSCAVVSSAWVINIDNHLAQSPLFKYLTGDADQQKHLTPTHPHKHHDDADREHREHDGHEHDGHEHKGHDHKGHDHKGHEHDGHEHASWWNKMPSKDSISAAIDNAVHSVEKASAKLHDDVLRVLDSDEDDRHADQTIYQLISENKHTTKFAELVDDYPDLVKLLNSTSSNHTLFVPVNKAFKHIPKDHDKPSKEFIETVLYYHVGLGDISAHDILKSYTLPTALNEKYLGDEPQRIRSSIGLGGIKLNFYSKVVKANIHAKNGYIHAVNNILVPPTWAGKEISLFPDKFSTLLLAWDKTEFGKFVHGVETTGTTVFAPSNKAFSRLGVKANAFLFNTETGKKYLSALLKYQVVRDATLYSDAFYDKTGDKDAVTEGGEREHYDLPTLLGDARISVDIARIAGFASIRVNGFTHVSFHDAVAKNGVIQVVDSVPIPPHPKKDSAEEYEGESIDVDDLIERLDPYVDAE